MWEWQKDSRREKSPNINPHIYWVTDFFSMLKRHVNAETIVFSANSTGQIGYPYADSNLATYKTLTHSDHRLNVKTIKFLEENIEENLGSVISLFHLQKSGRFHSISIVS